MNTVSQEIVKLCSQPAHPDFKPRQWSGQALGYGMQLEPTFTLDQVAGTTEYLLRQLRSRIEGDYCVDEGIAASRVSWLALRHVSLDDKRIFDIAISVGASKKENWQTQYSHPAFPGTNPKLRRQVFLLGDRAALEATEFVSYGNLTPPTTMLSVNFNPLTTANL